VRCSGHAPQGKSGGRTKAAGRGQRCLPPGLTIAPANAGSDRLPAPASAVLRPPRRVVRPGRLRGSSSNPSRPGCGCTPPADPVADRVRGNSCGPAPAAPPNNPCRRRRTPPYRAACGRTPGLWRRWRRPVRRSVQGTRCCSRTATGCMPGYSKRAGSGAYCILFQKHEEIVSARFAPQRCGLYGPPPSPPARRTQRPTHPATHKDGRARYF